MPDSASSIATIQVIESERLQRLAAEARRADRKRSHLLLHSGPDDQVQRLVIAAQPETYVRPHVHRQQWEMLVLQMGRLDILIFTEDGKIVSRHALTQANPVIQIPAGCWHGCVVMDDNTQILEVKPGPYRANEFAPWAPAEGSEHAGQFVEWSRHADAGAQFSQ